MVLRDVLRRVRGAGRHGGHLAPRNRRDVTRCDRAARLLPRRARLSFRGGGEEGAMRPPFSPLPCPTLPYATLLYPILSYPTIALHRSLTEHTLSPFPLPSL